MIDPKLKFVCSNCQAVNRVPESRLNDGPVCGKCSQSLIPDHPVDLDDESFRKFITVTDVPVIVDFWATWCPPCRKMGPEFVAAATELAPNMVLAKVDTEAAQQAAAGFNIQGIPCLIAFQNGIEIARESGAKTTKQIVDWANSIKFPKFDDA